MSHNEIVQNGFDGYLFTLSDNWLKVIPMPTGPIKYLEIGTFYGGNICSIMKTYASAANSEVHCVDPWKDYNEYSEYKNDQQNIYTKFLANMSKLPHNEIDKLHIHRGFSSDVILSFPNIYFDIIYIDGNHDAQFVLEDAVLSFKKLKSGGYLIFDDYTWDGVKKGVHSFLDCYSTLFESPVLIPGIQCIIKKK